MRRTTEEQQKKQQRRLESQVRNRWAWTALFLFNIGAAGLRTYEKRSQWPQLLQHPFSFSVPIWSSVVVSILTSILFLFALVQFWMRVHNYRREQLRAEQEALRKAAPPTVGVWPPPPAS